ncbi:hypothetical protein [Streptomyces vilmorinianum]|uniref:hypothetical protein n=1 Tax=Streptomyces vilmorinianum TaxID=3051092 RepID=UPI0010FB714A|nr:hypothetical protein [Streptomyces vilmorinianum]
MTTATFTPDRTIPRSRRLATALRGIRAFTGAAVEVVVLGRYAEEAGVRNPRPEYVGGPD